MIHTLSVVLLKLDSHEQLHTNSMDLWFIDSKE